MASYTEETLPKATEASPLARHFVALLERLGPHDPPIVGELAARLLSAGENGDVCLDLRQETEPQALITALQQSSVVGAPGEWKPLILYPAGRLYLYRQWQAEHQLAAELIRRGQGLRKNVDLEVLSDGLQRLFPLRSDGSPDEQAIAAATAILKNFAVISGGPGTGKTTTVVKVLALLLEQAKTPLRIALTAPTGKAAARLRESISRARAALPCTPEVRAAIPVETATLHRLLGANASGTSFRYGAERQLRVDVVVLDEASMVNLTLMQQLLSALPKGAQLIILGDRDQLASVEAGAVLDDICGAGEAARSPQFAALLAALLTGRGAPCGCPDFPSGLADAIVTLKESRRFTAQGGIGSLCRTINAGQGEAALQLLRSGDPQVSWTDLAEPAALTTALADEVDAWVGDYLAAKNPQEALQRFGNFMLLTALRQGSLGSIALNLALEQMLVRRQRIASGKLWYAGRPVMITRNAPAQDLFNGDIGLCLPDPAADGALRVFFPTASGEVRGLAPLTLPAHETAFAMTVHKSQGSEFRRVLLLLPGQRSAILSRELLYTAVSRARESLKIFGVGEIFVAACQERIQRTSGLREELGR
ncbi:MAG: exodeoxyribonuclease V subunit alpha [Desulfuromonadales bacterium]|nr:exodeoxyribonuclease V subunit alpha [Desulfuromonadales bacterium]